MNHEHLRQRLLSAARAQTPSDAVPLGFERRVLAGLQARVPTPVSADWAAGLWRVAIPCLILICITGALQLQSPSAIERWIESPAHPDELETVMLDVLDPPDAW